MQENGVTKALQSVTGQLSIDFQLINAFGFSF
jgi:hypothetical protein